MTLAFISGIVIGCFFGVGIMCLMIVAEDF